MLSRCILAYVLLFLTFFFSYMVIIVFVVTHLHISIVVHKWIFWRTSASITSKEGTISHCVFVHCGSSLTVVPHSKFTRSRVRIGKGRRTQSVIQEWGSGDTRPIKRLCLFDDRVSPLLSLQFNTQKRW